VQNVVETIGSALEGLLVQMSSFAPIFLFIDHLQESFGESLLHSAAVGNAATEKFFIL
jgi:hypothetical protein